MSISTALRIAAGVSLSAVLAFGASTLKPGKAELKSAGVLAFGPEGILLVGDSAGAAIFALDTGDTKKSSGASVDVKGINEKIATLLGTAADQILINDVVINPVSKTIYIAVSRGRGPDAVPVILKSDASGKLAELSLANIPHARVSLADAPAADAKDARGNSRRMEAITDIGYVDGKVFVAGLSNEEFSSSLRSIPYPFTEASKGAGIEIYHGQHGRFETNSPVRKFIPVTINNQPHILAAYTCTPLVKIPVAELTPGAKVKGTTIAELGNRNRPLDMIAYSKGGQEYLLMANSSRGVMKMPAAGLDKYEPITAQTEKQGIPYETIESLKGVQQLDKYDASNALILVSEGSSVDLRTIALP